MFEMRHAAYMSSSFQDMEISLMSVQNQPYSHPQRLIVNPTMSTTSTRHLLPSKRNSYRELHAERQELVGSRPPLIVNNNAQGHASVVELERRASASVILRPLYSGPSVRIKVVDKPYVEIRHISRTKRVEEIRGMRLERNP